MKKLVLVCCYLGAIFGLVNCSKNEETLTDEHSYIKFVVDGVEHYYTAPIENYSLLRTAPPGIRLGMQSDTSSNLTFSLGVVAEVTKDNLPKTYNINDVFTMSITWGYFAENEYLTSTHEYPEDERLPLSITLNSLTNNYASGSFNGAVLGTRFGTFEDSIPISGSFNVKYQNQ